MSINNDIRSKPDLENHPLFGNRKRVLATPTVNIKGKQDKIGKLIVTSVILILMLVAAFIIGLWSNSSSTGVGNTIVSWPGQVWQQFLQNRVGVQTGSGLAQQSPWVLARVAGIMAYVLSFASVSFGLLMSLRWKWVKDFIHPTATFYLHKILSLLTVVFLVLHILGLALDSYLNINLLQSLIPFSVSSYRPFWTGLGTLAVYGTILVIVTAYLASKLGYKVWRTIHYLTFGIFGMSLIHGIMTGTDTGTLWVQIIYISSALVVAGLTMMRFVKKPIILKAGSALKN